MSPDTAYFEEAVRGGFGTCAGQRGSRRGHRRAGEDEGLCKKLAAGYSGCLHEREPNWTFPAIQYKLDPQQ